MSERRSKTDSHFGASVSKSLAEARMTQTEVAERIGSSTSYVNQMLTGRKRPSPQWVDLIADTLKASDRQRVELHRAAAKDYGFKLDLRKK
jgi:transcriptional regulator with XRE-family HTH domain